MEAETALVGTEGRVELHTVALLDLALALVVLPDDAELDDALGDGDDLEGFLVLWVLLEERGGLEGGDELWWMSGGCRVVWVGRNRTYPSWLAQTRAQTWWIGIGWNWMELGYKVGYK